MMGVSPNNSFKPHPLPGCNAPYGCSGVSAQSRCWALMRIFAITVVATSLLGSATLAASEADAVSYAQALPVSAIDSSLPSSRTLAEWLAARAQGNRVAWESNDCGEQTGDPATTPDDFPICAEARFVTCDGHAASVAIAVGTLVGGMRGPPELFWAQTGDAHDAATLSAFGRAAPICTGAPNSFKPKPLRGSS